MRQRIEDLGRIAVILDNMLESAFFNEYRMNPQDIPEWFARQPEEIQRDVLLRFASAVGNLEAALMNVRKIALGQDPLNEPERRDV